MTSAYSTPLPSARAAADPWKTHPVFIANIRKEIEGVATYDLAFCDESFGATYRFAPGQFNMLYLPGAGEIAISCSDDPQRSAGHAHTVRVAGERDANLGEHAGRSDSWIARSLWHELADVLVHRPRCCDRDWRHRLGAAASGDLHVAERSSSIRKTEHALWCTFA